MPVCLRRPRSSGSKVSQISFQMLGAVEGRKVYFFLKASLPAKRASRVSPVPPPLTTIWYQVLTNIVLEVPPS